MDSALQNMIYELGRGDDVYLPSKYWEFLNAQNLGQLESEGFDNFKQTIARNYFTWLVGRRDAQYRYLMKRVRPSAWPALFAGLFSYDPSSRLNRGEQRSLGLFTRMLWKYAERRDPEGLLRRLSEPTLGNPFRIFMGGRLISQDLANSVLEYYSVREGLSFAGEERVTVCELGAGYGRNAYVFLNAIKNCKYIIVDIPPALYVAQRYLTAVFGGRKTFKFRHFDSFAEVENEFWDSELAFLLPHQAEQLPRKFVDLFMNISSLHEMTARQISHYFKVIDDKTKGFFYSKQWLVSENAHDGLRLRPEDYPVPPNWRQKYLRPAAVQSYFFEALYAVD